MGSPKRVCELCGVDITHMKSNARYCSRKHKNKHYRHINRDKVNMWKKNWNKLNNDKIVKSSKEKRQREIKLYGFSKNYLRVYARRHKEDLRKLKKEKCFKCGSAQYLSIHHTKYTKDPKDWEFVCYVCHIKIHEPTTLL